MNELRAIAAFCVVFHHLESYNYRDGIPSLFTIHFFKSFIQGLGKNGVYLFFVLSGFLITSLLLNENEANNTISLKKFYLRRIFRIWPLYFIIIFLSVIIIPLLFKLNFFQSETYYFTLVNNGKSLNVANVSLYAFFLSNFAIPIVGAAQTWSVSVEEQFYIIWPNVIKFIKGKYLGVFLCTIIILFFIILKFKVPYLKSIIETIPIYIMAVGAFFAYYYKYYRSKLDAILKNNSLFVLHLFLLLFFLFTNINSNVNIFLFALLVLFVIAEKKINLRNKVLNYFGTISYGIYMYHPICMFISSALAKKIFTINSNIVGYKILFYVFTFFFTIVISWLSYNLIEKKLINIKDTKYKPV